MNKAKMLEKVRNYRYGDLIGRLFFWIIFWVNFGWFFFYILGFFDPLVYLTGYLLFGYFSQFLEIGNLFFLCLVIFGLIGGTLFQKKSTIVFWAIFGAIYWASIGLVYNAKPMDMSFSLFYPFSRYWEDLTCFELISVLLIVSLWGAIIGGVGDFIGDKIIKVLNRSYVRNVSGAQKGFIIGFVIIWVPILLIVVFLEFIGYAVYDVSTAFINFIEISTKLMVVTMGTGGTLGFLIGGRRKSKEPGRVKT